MAKLDWNELLLKCPTTAFEERLWRLVDKAAYDGGQPPAYLFTSRNRNRYNPAGLDCLYMSEDETTAKIEFHQLEEAEVKGGGLNTLKKYFRTLKTPTITYTAELKAGCLIDLCDDKTVKHLSLTDGDLFGTWDLKKDTPANQLGSAIAAQTRICGIRYPSAALAKMMSWGVDVPEQDQNGANIVIFKDSLISPDQLIINDSAGKSFERWPE